MEEEECSERVKEAWENAISNDGVSLLEIQSRVLGELWEWDREVMGDLEKRIKNARRDLERCRRAVISQGTLNQEHLQARALVGSATCVLEATGSLVMADQGGPKHKFIPCPSF